MTGEHYLPDAAATIAAGAELAAELQPGAVVALTGGLGAGKTHFTKGIVQGLGSTEEVTSPTFTLVHEYTGGRLPVYHFDFYRMVAAAEVHAIGWDEYLLAEGVCVVEWADRFPEIIPAEALWIGLETQGEGRVIKRRGRAG